MSEILEILSGDSSRKTADYAVECALQNYEHLKELVELTRFAKEPINWRALRVLELCDQINSELIKPYINTLAAEFPKYKTDGHLRMLPKIFSNHVNDLSENSLGIIADKCFKILLNPKEPLAVLVNSMQFLFDITKIYPDIKPELYAVIDQIYDEKEQSGAIRSRAGKLLNSLDFENFK